ncbi:MAG: ROK family protein [Bacteroidales bacterium]|nr:ROK family protein [Bacteroidales bacterium]
MAHYIGIDIGGTTISIGLVDSAGSLLEETILPTRAEEGVVQALQRIEKIIGETIDSQGHNFDLKAIGLGVPGILDKEQCSIVESSNLKNWVGHNIAGELSKHFGVPVSMGNDADMAAMGEFWQGAGQGADSFLMVTLGSGIGGAIITKGQPLCLAQGSLELGHTIVNFNGAACLCGKKGVPRPT